MIPFFIFYSMFGLQRVGDLVWAAGDQRAQAASSGRHRRRTTLAGEGLQHQDGHSHLLAYPVPNLIAYDPAFAYELAVIMQDGIRRMYVEQEDIFYYITLMNEPSDAGDAGRRARRHPARHVPLPRRDKKDESCGRSCSAPAPSCGGDQGAGILEEKYNVAADVWSVTSYKELYRDGNACERWNMLHPGRETARSRYVTAAA